MIAHYRVQHIRITKAAMPADREDDFGFLAATPKETDDA